MCVSELEKNSIRYFFCYLVGNPITDINTITEGHFPLLRDLQLEE